MVEAPLAEAFARDGFVVLPNFYDVETQIAPILVGIQQIVRLVAERHEIEVPDATPTEAMTRGMAALAKANRAWAGEVYDAVKQIPAFMRLVASAANEQLMAQLRPGSSPGLAANGYGIRIDHPQEEKFRTYWHQEFPVQMRSLDGVVFWSPLLDVRQNMGPVEIAVASHEAGLIPVVEDGGGVGRSGAYALRLENEREVVSGYSKVAPLSRPGDLLVMDFLTLHRSGINRSDHARWSMQFRYFNFDDPVGKDVGWCGSLANMAELAAVTSRLAKEPR